MRKKEYSTVAKTKKVRGPSNFLRVKAVTKISVICYEICWVVAYAITLISLIYITSSIVFYVRHEGYNSPTLFRDWSRIFLSQSLGLKFWILIHSNIIIGFVGCLAIWGEPPTRTMRYRIALKLFRIGGLHSDK